MWHSWTKKFVERKERNFPQIANVKLPEPGDSDLHLQAGVTWDQAGIFELTPRVSNPEACQQICRMDLGCLGFTWLAEEAPLQSPPSLLLPL